MGHSRSLVLLWILLSAQIVEAQETEQAEVAPAELPAGDQAQIVEAPAQRADAYRPVASPAAPRRVFGLGTSGGAGLAFFSTSSGSGSSGLGLMYEFGSIEALLYLTNDVSIDIAIPLGSSLFLSADSDFRLFAWQTDFFLDFRTAGSVFRFFGGPGLGLRVLAGTGGSIGGGAAGFGLRIPALAGVEVGDSEAFAFRLFAEPFVELIFGSGGFSAFLAGALVKVGLYGFFVQG